jgi:uncharacterized membrane protein
MSASVDSVPTRKDATERRSSWRGGLVLALAILWVGGLGSVAAIVGHVCWSRGARATERRYFRAGLVIALIGLLLTGFLVAVVIGAASS